MEGTLYNTNNVQFKINDKIIGEGALIITEHSLNFEPDQSSLERISIPWNQIQVHGVCPALPQRSIYFAVDQKFESRDYCGKYIASSRVLVEALESGNGNAQSDESAITEFWIFPDDENVIDIIYQTMKDCQALLCSSSNSSDSDDSMDSELNIQSLNIHNGHRYENAEEHDNHK